MTVAIYARVSTRDKGQDTENQLAQLRAFCRRQGWEVYREYVDAATGSKATRPAFQSLFEDAHQRRFDLVLFWSLDRFSREGVLATLQHLQRLDSYGAGWRSFTEQYLDSCGLFKDAVLSILATIAKQERVRISERVRAGLETARKKGKRLGRRPLDVNTLKIRQAQGSIRQVARQFGVSHSYVARLRKPSRCREGVIPA